jgi:DNA polymerase III subunit delta
MHTTAWLKDPSAQNIGPVAVLYGAERFLKQHALEELRRQILGPDDDEVAVTRFAGETIDLRSVVDALLTVSMWSPRQIVLVEDADDFVSNFRDGLEKYLDRPAKKSVLILDVKSWPASTRLAKKTLQIGLPLDCNALKPAELTAWLVDWCKRRYERKIGRDAAQRMIELAGTSFGLLDQELAKLTSYVGEAGTIDTGTVEKLVGGWKAETTWKMLDAVRDGRIDLALPMLDKLLVAGEHPLKLLGGINYVFRPLVQATEISRRGTALNAALAQAGVKSFQLAAFEQYLRRIGRVRAEKIGHFLLQADLDAKGAGNLPDRVGMERLLVQLAGVGAG